MSRSRMGMARAAPYSLSYGGSNTSYTVKS
jgi:hypothetical protein